MSVRRNPLREWQDHFATQLGAALPDVDPITLHNAVAAVTADWSAHLDQDHFIDANGIQHNGLDLRHEFTEPVRNLRTVTVS